MNIVMSDLKKLTRKINTVILIMVFGLMSFFLVSHAMFLVWFSIPTALIYIFGYYLISKERLDIYLRMVYGWLTLYMSVTTVCLGYGFGFHLYSLSMIPIIFYSEYMAYKLGSKSVHAMLYSVLVIICYLLSTGYSAYVKPVYVVDSYIAGLFWIFNSLTVLGFVTFYSWILIRMTIKSDSLLSERANKDPLTGLYNRHYTMEKLKEAYNGDKPRSIAMIDIDNFKHINDGYGHSAGDEVLKKIASVMTEVCGNGTIGRWGGEEFLILFEGAPGIIEKLRSTVEDTVFEFDGRKIDVTVTAGVASMDKEISLDKWIIEADEKLYYGKNNGKNRVVC